MTEAAVKNKFATVGIGIDDRDRAIIGGIDARVRISATVIVLVAVLVTSSIAVLVTVALGALIFARATGLSFLQLQHRLRHIEGFMLAFFVLLPLTIPGDGLLTIGPLVVSGTGLMRAAILALKVLTCGLLFFALLSSLEPVRFGRALAMLGCPGKLVHLLLFSVRYVSVLRKEWNRLGDAMRARAFRPATNMHTLQTSGNLIGMVLVRSAERAERVDEAMRCRAFSGQFPLRSPKPLQKNDWLFLAAACASAVAIVAIARVI